MKYLLSTLAVVVILTGCGREFIEIKSTFNPSEIASYDRKGANTISGSALVKQRGGGVVNCAGGEVSATPYSTYAAERMIAIYGNQIKGYSRFWKHKDISKADPAYLATSRNTICDAQGFFKFSNLPDGDYFVTTEVSWMVNDYLPEGGFLMLRVKVKDGETKEIVLAP